MNETFTVEILLTDGQTIYINDCTNFHHKTSAGVPVIVVVKRERNIIFNVDHVVYIGPTSLFDTPEAPPEDSGWIAVSDRKPEPHEPVLGVSMRLHPIIGECWMVEGVFYFPRYKSCIEVTHWRPMPALPGEVDA